MTTQIQKLGEFLKTLTVQFDIEFELNEWSEIRGEVSNDDAEWEEIKFDLIEGFMQFDGLRLPIVSHEFDELYNAIEGFKKGNENMNAVLEAAEELEMEAETKHGDIMIAIPHSPEDTYFKFSAYGDEVQVDFYFKGDTRRLNTDDTDSKTARRVVFRAVRMWKALVGELEQAGVSVTFNCQAEGRDDRYEGRQSLYRACGFEQIDTNKFEYVVN